MVEWYILIPVTPYRVAKNKILHQTIMQYLCYTVYPLHLNYTTTLPCKTVTMKITFFHAEFFSVTPE